jgi:glycosyltransferase involved in cell wall biosynthesis
MKIALLTHHFLPHYTAGGEQYAYRVAQGLRRQGHTVEVVCIESITTGSLTPTCKTDIYNDLVVHRLFFDIRQAPNQFEWSFRNPELGQWVKNFLKHFKPDLVHINSGYLLTGTVSEAAFELGLPTVLTLHDYWFLCPRITLLRHDGKICEEPVPVSRCVWCSISEKRRYHLPDKHLDSALGDIFVKLNQSPTVTQLLGVTSQFELMAERRTYLKQVFEKIDLVISPSQFLIQKMQAYGFKSRQMAYLPFGLENSPLLSPQPRPPSRKLRIGYLGQFAPHKGVHLLLAAFQQLKSHTAACELILHGKISSNSDYERKLLKMAENDPDITFAGPYPNSKVGRVLSGLDILVVPSVWYENRPTVIVEALATQTPVIAARLGGMAELITHNENGLLFETGSVESLALQLRRLIDEPTLLSQLRQEIQAVPTVEEEISRLELLYETVLPKPPVKEGIAACTVSPLNSLKSLLVCFGLTLPAHIISSSPISALREVICISAAVGGVI